jgi:hypothetical protein
LALLAALFPDRMLALVMAEVERIANDLLPMAQRAPRVAALERELDELHHVERCLSLPQSRQATPSTARRLHHPQRCWECASRPRSRAPPDQRRRGWSGFKYPLKGPPPSPSSVLG